MENIKDELFGSTILGRLNPHANVSINFANHLTEPSVESSWLEHGADLRGTGITSLTHIMHRKTT
jgi:hypothetical protein